MRIVVLQHETVAERAGIVDIIAQSDQLHLDLLRIVQGRIAALVRIDKDLGKGVEDGLLIALLVLLEVGVQILFAGRGQRHQVLGEKLQLLRQAAADNLVVLVEPHGQRFAIEHGLTDVLLHQAIELCSRWWPVPAFLPGGLHPFDFTCSHNYSFVTLFQHRFGKRTI